MIPTLAAVRTGLQADRMVYQREAKERAARAAGLRFDAYYSLPYQEWASIRDARTGDDA